MPGSRLRPLAGEPQLIRIRLSEEIQRPQRRNETVDAIDGSRKDVDKEDRAITLHGLDYFPMARIRTRKERLFHLLHFCVTADEEVVRHVWGIEKVDAELIRLHKSAMVYQEKNDFRGST
jgi:hypothetical protein